MAAFYLGCNRSKRSIVLDLKQDSGRKALFKLAETADVLMHNYRPDPAKRLGVEYEKFEKINPRLVYVAAYGYRAAGPMGAKAAYDDIIQAGSGLAALQSVVAGQPRFLPTIVADKTSSNGVVSALLAALFARERTGKGQAVEVPMFETLVSFVMVEHLYGETFMPALDTAGYKRVLNKERRPYPSKDGYFALLPYTDGHWREFCVLVGRDDLAKDPRFQGMANRLKNVEQYYSTLAGSAPSGPTPNGSSCSRIPTCRTGRSTRSTTCSSTRSSRPPATGRKSIIRRRASCACRASRRASARPRPRSPACSRGSASTASRCCAKLASPRLKSMPC